jgi:uncharacterized membrane protein YbhN (UPF0104 family)
MISPKKSLLKAIILVAGIILAARAIRSFPWRGTYQALLGVNLMILSAALAVNLISLIAKGTSWHILLRPLAPNRWSSAQIANLIGSTVNCISVSVAGEAVRIHSIIGREEIPLEAGFISVVWERLIEGIGLAVFLILAPTLLPLPNFLRGVQTAAAIILSAFLALIFVKKSWPMPAWLPQPVRQAVLSLMKIGSWRRVFWPVVLGILNWLVQWATFHLTLAALGVQPTPAASLTALLATNLGGVLRLTPANLGIFQATMVASLVTFGVPSERAMAASLALQAIQTLPVIIVGLLFAIPWRLGRKSWRPAGTAACAQKEPV